MNKIRVGIVGYGNLGRALHRQINLSSEMKVDVVFTRRETDSIFLERKTDLVKLDKLNEYKDKIDVLALMVGSAKDLMPLAMSAAESFDLIDAYDNHELMTEYATSLNEKAKKNGRLALYGCGWDPGIMSLARGFFESVLPYGRTVSCWGEGVSQGHSQALLEVDGVENGVQFTLPNKRYIKKVIKGNAGDGVKEDMHKRLCYVAVKDKKDKKRIYDEIVNMPCYFEPYDTKVVFCNKEKIDRLKKKMEHEGRVLRQCDEAAACMDLKLKMKSNPMFTAYVLAAYIPALVKMKKEGKTGAISVFSVPFSKLVKGYEKFV